MEEKSREGTLSNTVIFGLGRKGEGQEREGPTNRENHKGLVAQSVKEVIFLERKAIPIPIMTNAQEGPVKEKLRQGIWWLV